MSNEEDDKRGVWVPAILIESPTTPQQRERNYRFYERIRDGVPGSDREQGLKAFWFEVPNLPMFRLDPSSDCYRRLVSYVVGHCDDKCDADDEVERLRALVFKACSLGDDAAFMRKDCAEFMAGFDEIRAAAVKP